MGSKPKGISASRGAAVLGLSEYSTPFTVWQELMEEIEPGFNKKNGHVLPPEPDNAAIRWGSAFESAVIELAEREQGGIIVDREREYSHGDFITCHIDGRYKNYTQSIILHEGKTTSAFAYRNLWGEAGTDKIPRNYQVQVQHQMLCTGASECIVSVLVFPETPDAWERLGWEVKELKSGYALIRNKEIVNPSLWASVLCDMGYFHQYPVKANIEVQKQLIELYTAFWNNHVLAAKPPEPVNIEDLKRLCPEPKGTVIVNEKTERLLKEYSDTNREIKRVKDRQTEIQAAVINYARQNGGALDEESAEAFIFRNNSGEKLASWYKRKDGVLVFKGN